MGAEKRKPGAGMIESAAGGVLSHSGRGKQYGQEEAGKHAHPDEFTGNDRPLICMPSAQFALSILRAVFGTTAYETGRLLF